MTYDNDPTFKAFLMSNDNSLVLCYHMNEGTGTDVYDDSDETNHGELDASKPPAWDSSPKFGRYCLEFDASNSEYMTIPYSSSLAFGLEFSIEFWVRFNTLTANHVIVNKGSYMLWIGRVNTSNKIWFYTGDGTSWDFVSSTKDDFVVDTWYHIVCTYNNKVRHIYIDGIDDTDDVSAYNYTGNSDEIHVGSTSSLSQFLDGKLDELRFWSKELTSTDVANRNSWGEAIGEEVTDYCSFFNVDDTMFDNVGKGQLVFDKSITDVVTPVIGCRTEIMAGYGATLTKIYSGYIYSVRPTNKKYWCPLRDRTWEMVRRRVTGVYLDDDASDMLTDMVNDYCKNIYPVHIDTSGKTVSKMKANDNKMFTKATELAKFVGDWVFYTDVYGFLYFEERGTTSSGKTITTGDNIKSNFSIIDTPEGFINNLKLLGYKEYFYNKDTFNAGVGQEDFDCDYEVHDSKVTVDGVLQTGGLNFNDADVDYVVDWDDGDPKIRRRITFKTAMTGGETVVVEYNYPISMPIQGENAASVEQYGQFDGTVQAVDLQTLDDATQLFNSILDITSTPKRQATGVRVIADTDYKSGQTIRVVDSDSNTDEDMVMRRVKFHYSTTQGFYCTLDLGDAELTLAQVLAEHERRIMNLEHELAGTAQVVVQTVSLSGFTFDVAISLDVKAYTNAITNAAIYNHSDSKFNECNFNGTTYGGWVLKT